MSNFTFTEKELKDAVKNSKSIAGICRYLGLVPRGGNYKTIKFKIKEYNIDTTHFTGQGWNVGLTFRPQKMFTATEALVENSPCKCLNSIKRILIREKLKEYKCEICGLTEWMGLPIVLELHHINGNNRDNRLENLQWLCPNCHSMTDNFRGRRKKYTS